MGVTKTSDLKLKIKFICSLAPTLTLKTPITSYKVKIEDSISAPLTIAEEPSDEICVKFSALSIAS